MPHVGLRTRVPPGTREESTASIGQVSTEPLTWTVATEVTVTNVTGVLIAAGNGTGRIVVIQVPPDADGGIRVNFGAAATATDFLIPPGGFRAIATEQAINAIRESATNVDVSVMSGVV